MPRHTLVLPRLGETMEHGTIVRWCVAPGQPFRRGETILELETDKTVVELPALADGTLVEVLAEVGDMLDVGASLAVVDGELAARPRDTAPVPPPTISPDRPSSPPHDERAGAPAARRRAQACPSPRYRHRDRARIGPAGPGYRGRRDRAGRCLAGHGRCGGTASALPGSRFGSRRTDPVGAWLWRRPLYLGLQPRKARRGAARPRPGSAGTRRLGS